MSETPVQHDLEAIISRVRPEHRTVEWYNGGDNRSIAVVGGAEAFRFPKNQESMEVGRYEFEAIKLLQGRLSVAIPQPIELAPDGAYNVQSFLPGKVLSKQAVTELPFEKRRQLGISIAGVMNELNANVTKDELLAIPTKRPFARSKDDYYAAVYETTAGLGDAYSTAYRQNYERLQQLRPNGSASNIIVFGDFSSPNLVLSDDDLLYGVIDWTELGLGDIHNELRPTFSVIGQEAFESILETLDSSLGPVDLNLVRLCAVVHELTVLVSGKQTGVLTPERSALAVRSLNQWLGEGWAG